jgi:anthraniloyl-CoA monooxygenase
MTRADMDRVRDDFVRSTQLAAEAGFDWLELHCAHGYLLSSFISPLTNQRSDEYGGQPGQPAALPAGGVPRHARRLAGRAADVGAHLGARLGRRRHHARRRRGHRAAFKAAGADLIDCSSGQVSKAEKPVFGRMFQTPFADRVRNEAGVPTIAVGAISEADHVNSIIAAGRADLCAVARPHLANPAWTLMEAAKIGYLDLAWPQQYRAAKSQLERELERADSRGADRHAVAAGSRQSRPRRLTLPIPEETPHVRHPLHRRPRPAGRQPPPAGGLRGAALPVAGRGHAWPR